MDKKQYMTPDVEIIEFEVEDVMMVSVVTESLGWKTKTDTDAGWGSVDYSQF